MRKISVLTGTLLVQLAFGPASFAQTKDQDPAVLRRQCAHAVKIRLNIKETGSSDDLKGVRGAVAEVDRCVANGGKR